jgi:hypothetical protein
MSQLVTQKFSYTLLAVPIAVAAMVLSGCSSGGSANSQSTAGVDVSAVEATVSPDNLVKKDQKHWALPTDAYTGTTNGLYVAVKETVVQDCMAKKGLSYEVYPYSAASEKSQVGTGSGHMLFNEEIAAKYGYSAPPEDSIQPRLDIERKQDQNPSSWKQERDACFAEADKADIIKKLDTQGGLPSSVVADVNPPGLDTAAAKWRSCMAPLGLADLEKAPGGYPSSSFAQQIGATGNEEDYKDPSQHPVTDYELKVAVQDAKCRASSGYDTILYNAQWSASYNYVKKHLNELTVLRQKSAKVKDESIAFLKSHGNYTQ